MRTLAVVLVLSASVALAQAPALFRAPADAEPARRYPHDRSLLVDCAAHGAWAQPPDWATARSEDDVLAISPDGRALLVRVGTRTRSAHVRTRA